MPMLRLTRVNEDQMLSGNLEFYHVKTPASFLPTADRDTETADYYKQARVWERVIEIIRSYSNPVIVGPLTEQGFSFAVEHGDRIGVTALQAGLRQMGTVDFANDATVDLSGIEIIRQSHFLLAAAVDGYEGETVVSGDAVDLAYANEGAPGETPNSAAAKYAAVRALEESNANEETDGTQVEDPEDSGAGAGA